MPHANHRGVRNHYQVEGEGPPLVLQHGFTHSLRRWYLHGYVEALREDHRLILVDARGHGSSDKPHDPSAYTLAAQGVLAQAVHAVRLGEESPRGVGERFSPLKRD